MADPKVVALRAGPPAKKGASTAGTRSSSGAGGRSGAGAGGDAFEAGVARASGERAKRRRTPLLTAQVGATMLPVPALDVIDAIDIIDIRDGIDSIDAFDGADVFDGLDAVDGVDAIDIKDVVDVIGASDGAIRTYRPRPVPKSGPALTAKAAFTSGTRPVEPRSGRRPGSARRPGTSAPASKPRSAPPAGSALPPAATPSPARTGSGVDDLVRFAIATLRGAAAAAGLSGEDIERQVAGTLAFLRRRLNGDYTVDAFGFDEDFTKHAYIPLLRPLYTSWFRVEVRGIKNIPSTGGALVVANHSGTLALDSLMTQVAVYDEHPAHRHLRMLGADLVFRTPVVGEVARKSGCTLAANPDAERLLASGELAGVFPEGFKGVGKPFSERYKLQRFGRGGFVAAALRTGVPIVPCSIVGAEEIYPIIGNLKTVARLIGAPYVPVTPTFPLLGPLGLIPLPSKWIIEFGSPVDTSVLGSQAADDPMVVFDLTDRVRETIQQTLYSLLLQRRSVFF